MRRKYLLLRRPASLRHPAPVWASHANYGATFRRDRAHRFPTRLAAENAAHQLREKCPDAEIVPVTER